MSSSSSTILGGSSFEEPSSRLALERHKVVPVIEPETDGSANEHRKRESNVRALLDM
jgi:hypothetical protein